MPAPEQIILEGTQARVAGGDGAQFQAELKVFVRAINKSSVIGLDDECLPKNVCWKVVAGPLTVCIVELDPQIRSLLWIDEAVSLLAFGPEATYRHRRLALPYVVLKVPFLKRRIVPRVELFYRNQPLRLATDELYWSNLLNVSPNAYGCRAWVCTQYLGRERIERGLCAGLHALVTHLFGGGFNRSSEAHEGASAFSKAQAENVDPRVTNLDRWEQESIKDPRFILEIPWKPVGLTVRQLIEEELRVHRVAPNLGVTGELVNLLVGSANGKNSAKAGNPDEH